MDDSLPQSAEHGPFLSLSHPELTLWPLSAATAPAFQPICSRSLFPPSVLSQSQVHGALPEQHQRKVLIGRLPADSFPTGSCTVTEGCDL